LILYLAFHFLQSNISSLDYFKFVNNGSPIRKHPLRTTRPLPPNRHTTPLQPRPLPPKPRRLQQGTSRPMRPSNLRHRHNHSRGRPRNLAPHDAVQTDPSARAQESVCGSTWEAGSASRVLPFAEGVAWVMCIGGNEG
jgi:hypothetical protein